MTQTAKVKRMQVSEMTVQNLYLAVEYEKFAITDLLQRANQVAEGNEYDDVVKYIKSFDDPHLTSGSWHKAPPTIL